MLFRLLRLEVGNEAAAVAQFRTAGGQFVTQFRGTRMPRGNALERRCHAPQVVLD